MKGTAAYLMYKTGTFNHGQGAVFIAATKLRTRKEPFIDIPLIDTQAAGALGEAGASGWIDTHFADRFMGAMMVGMIPMWHRPQVERLKVIKTIRPTIQLTVARLLLI